MESVERGRLPAAAARPAPSVGEMNRPSNRPSWMTEGAYSEEVEQAKKRRKVEDVPVPAAAPALPPVNTSAASRAVYIEHFVDASTRKPNPYVADARDAGEDFALGALGARFGFARRVEVAASGDVVCLFVELDAAEACVKALHGRDVGGRRLCADFLREPGDGPLFGDDGAPAAAPLRPRTVLVGNAFAGDEGADFVARVADAVAVECSKFGPVARAVCDAEAREIAVNFVSSLSAGECVAAMRGLSFDGRVLSCELRAGGVEAAPPPPTAPLQDFWCRDDARADVDAGLRPPRSYRDRPPTPVPGSPASDSPAPASPAAGPLASLVPYGDTDSDDDDDDVAPD